MNIFYEKKWKRQIKLFFQALCIAICFMPQLTLAAVTLSAPMTDTLYVDLAGDYSPQPGDTLRFTTVLTNSPTEDAINPNLTITMDANTSLVVGSVWSSQHNDPNVPNNGVITGNTPGDTFVAVEPGTIARQGVVTIRFDAMIKKPVTSPATVSLQGTISSSYFATMYTDDPDTAEADDATTTPIIFVMDPVVTIPATSLLINAATQEVSGTHVENGATVNLYADADNNSVADDGVILGTDIVNANDWSIAASLSANTANNFIVQAVSSIHNNVVSSDVDVPTITTDNTPPAFDTFPGNLTLRTSTTSAWVSWDEPTATDNIDGNIIPVQTEGPTNNSDFPLGVSIITYTATDGQGNIATESFTVSVSRTSSLSYLLLLLLK